MKTTRSFLMIFSLMIFLVFSGCTPDEGRVGPSRSADSIDCMTDGVRTGKFIYISLTGDPIRQPGIAMPFLCGGSCYLKNNGLGGYEPVEASCTEQTIESSGVTGPGGILTANGTRGNWDILQGYIIYTYGVAKQPIVDGSTGCSADMEYRTRTDPHGEIALTSCSGNIAWVPPPDYLVSCGLTQREYDALNNPTSSPPATGIQIVSLNLIFQDGESGNGYPTETAQFSAINITDPNDYRKYSAPFSFSCILKTAESIDLSGFHFGGSIISDFFPDGCRTELTAIGSNIDLQTHVIRSDFFLPINQSLDISQQETIEVCDRWTPYQDPNDVWERSMNVPVLPVASSGDYLYLRINQEDLDILILILDNWLSDNAIWDINQDGIVNLEDLQIWMN